MLSFTSRLSWKYLFLTVNFLPAFLLFNCSIRSSDSSSEKKTSQVLIAKHSRPLTDAVFESTPARVARGKYLTHGLYCVSCHTEREETKPGRPPRLEREFSGALFHKTDSTYLYAPNLTPDKETGAGNFTDDMLARAIREGVGHDGRSLALPTMPWMSLRDLSDEDLASIIVYLRSIPAIRNKIPRRNVGDKREKTLVTKAYPLPAVREQIDYTNPVKRGNYLIGLAECAGCHTSWYNRNPGLFGGGNKLSKDDGSIFSPNITSDSTGIGGWTEDIFISVMRNGKGKSGNLNYVMPWITYRNLSDEDLSAIYQALMATYPVKHIVINGTPPSYCKVCESEHGAGSANQLTPATSFKKDFKTPSDLKGTYVSTKFDYDTLMVFYRKGKLSYKFASDSEEQELIAVTESSFMAEGMLAPLVFERDVNRNVRHVRFQGDVEKFQRLPE